MTWNPIFRRDLQDWEMGDIVKLFELFYAHLVDGIGADRAIWTGAKSRVFSVKSYYVALLGIGNRIFLGRLFGRPKPLVE